MSTESSSETISTQPSVSSAPQVAGAGAPREVSAAAIVRMMGLVSSADLKLYSDKLDLLSERITTLGIKLDKLGTQISGFATGDDIERLDIQIGALRQMLRENMGSAHAAEGASHKGAHPTSSGSGEADPKSPRKNRPSIFVTSGAPAKPSPVVTEKATEAAGEKTPAEKTEEPQIEKTEEKAE